MYLVGLGMGLMVMVLTQLPQRYATLVACDVGQGDAILITKGYNQVLIDGGPSSEKVLDCLIRHTPFWDRHLELIVLTNTDADHLRGLVAVLERYSLSEFVTADGVKESETLEQFLSLIKEKKVNVKGVERGDVIMVGTRDSLAFKVLSPKSVDEQYMAVYSNQIENPKREQILGASAKRGDLNERSVVLLWDESGYMTLLTGDAGDQTENEMLEAGILPDVDLLKVGHHGSKYASSLEFLEMVKPEQAIISVGKNNRYGHPTAETLARLSKIGAHIERTDTEGEIVWELKR